MKNTRNRPGTAQSLCFCGWALLALACGNINENPPAEEIPSGGTAGDPCEGNSSLPECDETDPPPNPPISTDESGGDGPPEPSERELVQAAAENVLRVNCGNCHGSDLAEDAAQAEMNYIDDVDELVRNGKIVPRNSANSPVVQYMRDGIMPPPGVQPRPSQREIDLVADFVDNPLYWPEVAGPALCDDQLQTFDDVYSEVAADLRGEDAEDRPFLRYLTLMNRYNAGVCETELDTDRWALSKALNMLSIRAAIRQPLAIDEEETIYRIDLRDYEWNRSIVVDGETFDDAWEAIIDKSPYAVPFVGDQADDVRDDTETDVAVLFADAMQEAAAFGNLYYALIDVDVTQSLATFIAEDLGIDVEANIAEREVVRAGTTQSDLTRQNRVLERHDIGVRNGAFWQGFDFEPDVANDNIFVNPFNFDAAGTQAIFSLPNGMLGFIIADANDNIVDESNILLDRISNDFIARTAVSCSGCHARGFNEVEDEVREFVLDNRTQFSRDDFEAVDEIYVEPDVFAGILEDDSVAFRRALSAAGVPTLGADPVQRVFLQFEDDLTIARAAGDLGLNAEQLDRDLRELAPELQVLEIPSDPNQRARRIDRDDFTALYAESLCILHIASDNQPDPALCETLLE